MKQPQAACEAAFTDILHFPARVVITTARIGTEMLGEIRLLLNGTECFAIAYAHLKDFYGRIGFRDSNEQKAPAFLRLRINKYRAENPQQTFILIRKVR